MNLKVLTSKTGKFVTDNSPTILTAIGAVGLVTTAYLTGKASFRASRVLSEELYTASPEYNDENISKVDVLKTVWHMYIPAVATGTLSVAAIIGANRIGTRRAAAMATAFTLSERALAEYKDKVVEQIGANKEQKVRDGIAQDRVDKLGALQPKDVIHSGTGTQLFMDAYSSRVWEATVEEVKGAINDVNYQINAHGYASLSDLYDHLGLDHTRLSDDVGWNGDKLIDVKFSTTMAEYNGSMRSVIVLDFTVAPVRNFFRLHG